MNSRPLRVLISLFILAALTFTAHATFHVNATTAGFIYLLLVLVIASIWGFVEASILSIAATLTFNYFFFPRSERSTSPIRTIGLPCSVSSAHR